MKNNTKVVLENHEDSLLSSFLSPEEIKAFEEESERVRKECEPLARASEASQRITEKDLSVTVTM